MAGSRTWRLISGSVCSSIATVPVTYRVCAVYYEHKAKLRRNQKTNLKKRGTKQTDKQNTHTHTQNPQNNETCSGKQREGNRQLS